ncbi:MAG: nitrogen regulation protein NR(II), partial [Gemmatimonadales bacterium]
MSRRPRLRESIAGAFVVPAQGWIAAGCLLSAMLIFGLDLAARPDLDLLALYAIPTVGAIGLQNRRGLVSVAALCTVLVGAGWFLTHMPGAPWLGREALARGAVVGVLWVLAGLGLLAKAQMAAALQARDRIESTLERAVAEERAAAAGQLAEAERRLREVLEGSPDGVVVSDAAGLIQLVNHPVETMFGYTRAELLGQSVEVLVPEAARGRHPRLRQIYQTAPAAHPMWQGRTVSARRKDGTVFPAEILLSPLASGTERLVIASIRDVTDRQALEANLRQAQKMEAVGQLTGGVAHDLNNMLTVVISNAEQMLVKLPPTSPLVADVRESLDAALRSATMIRRLLNFSRREVLAARPLAPAPLLEAVAKILPRVIPESVRIVTRIPATLPAIRADPTAIEQILLNLATNARDAMPQGGTLELAAYLQHLDAGYIATHPWVEPGNYVTISMSDTGAGMDDMTQARAFEPFFTTKPPGVGTGLGLALVDGLVK